MKLLLTAELLCLASGFVMPNRNGRAHLSSRPTLLQESMVSDFGSDFGSAMPKEVSPYERIGISEEQLALGINAQDVIDYIGT